MLGRRHFIVRYGILMVGLGGGVVTWLLMGLIGVVVPALALQMWSSLATSLILLVTLLAGGLLSGWVWGRLMWNLNEERYRRSHTGSV